MEYLNSYLIVLGNDIHTMSTSVMQKVNKIVAFTIGVSGIGIVFLKMKTKNAEFIKT